MFEKFTFTNKQVEKYFESALKDFNIARGAVSEVTFVFCYNCLLKLAIAVCAKNGWRVKSRQGHHVALISKLAESLKNNEVEAVIQEMRAKRNKDLYSGGVLITNKEAAMYFDFTAKLIKQVEEYLDFNKLF